MNQLVVKNHFALADKIYAWNNFVKTVAPKKGESLEEAVLNLETPKVVLNNLKEIKSFCLIVLRQVESIEIKLKDDLYTRGRAEN